MNEPGPQGYSIFSRAARASVSARLAAALIGLNVLGIGATVYFASRGAAEAARTETLDGWLRSTEQTAAAVAGGIKWKKADVVADGYKQIVNEAAQPVDRALAVNRADETISEFAPPGVDTAIVDAAVANFIKDAPAKTGIIDMPGAVLVIAPAFAKPGSPPDGYLALAWSTKRLEAGLSALTYKILVTQSAGMLLLVVVLLLRMRSLISRPLSDITARIAGLSAGDYTSEVRHRDRRDEIGVIARALDGFRIAALATERSTRESAEVIRVLGQGLEAASKGNLSYSIETEFPDSLEQLRAHFNEAVATLRSTISLVKSNTESVRSGTVEIAQSSGDLSRRAGTQAANIEETAAAMAEITEMVRKTTEGAIMARDVVEAAKLEAGKGGEVVRRSIEAIDAVQESSRKITDIIGVIDEIAFQTNLLAFNAGVEAARAGDAGRGFAVVAQEVRALAQRSAGAAKEIKELLSGSHERVVQGVQLVSETGGSLKSITGRIAEIDLVVRDIATRAQQQAAGLQEVKSAIDRMDRMTQQTAALVEQTTTATHTLSEQSGELATIIAQFNTGERPGDGAEAAEAADLARAV